MKINLNLNPVLLVVCLVLIALLVSTNVIGQDEDAVTLHVVERAATDVVTDIGEEGDTVGDVLTFANEVYDETNENLVGTDNGYCIRTVVGAAWECEWTLTLEDGQITVAGPFYDTSDSVLSVTGGTGTYSHARGEMALSAHNDEATEFNFVYDLHME